MTKGYYGTGDQKERKTVTARAFWDSSLRRQQRQRREEKAQKPPSSLRTCGLHPTPPLSELPTKRAADVGRNIFAPIRVGGK